MEKFSGLWDWEVAEKLVPYFILTEYIPSICFIYSVNTFSKAFTGEDERLQEEQRARLLQREVQDARDAAARANH